MRVEADGGAEVDAADRRIRWAITLEPGGSWSARLSVRPASAGRPAGDAGGAASRASSGFASATSLRSDLVPLDVAYRQSIDDLAALRLYGRDPDGLPVVAAGAPWFMALFGRDSLLTAFMALLVDHDLAVGVLEALASLQGSRTVPETEEQPGASRTRSGTAARRCYYGTVDATRSSSCCSANACAGASPGSSSSHCSRTPTVRWSGSSGTATATATGT